MILYATVMINKSARWFRVAVVDDVTVVPPQWQGKTFEQSLSNERRVYRCEMAPRIGRIRPISSRTCIFVAVVVRNEQVRLCPEIAYGLIGCLPWSFAH